MNSENKRLIDLYPYRINRNLPEFLLLRRASGKIYSDQWRMVGGKCKTGETRSEAALRELQEETGLLPSLFWCVPTINHFYEPQSDAIHLIPAFAAEIERGMQIELDDEHVEFGWFSLEEAESRVIWPEQKRIIACISRIIREGHIAKDWIIDTQHI